MKIISVSEAKATLSQQIRHVSRGEEILITQRGKPVARLMPVGERDLDADLAELEQAGLVRRPTRRLSKGFWKLKRPEDAAGAVRAAVLDERESNW